jgi:hypothetical protein
VVTVDLGDATCPDEAWPWDSDVPLHGRFDPYDHVARPSGSTSDGCCPGGDEESDEARPDGGGGFVDSCGWCGTDGDEGCWDGSGGGGGGWFGDGDGDVPPEPGWALDASAQVLRERLAAAVSGPADWDVAGLVDVLAPAGSGGAVLPGGLDAAGVVDGIVAAQRVINHFQAVQRQWIAALARPGVAVPVGQLVDLCRHSGRHVPGALRPPAELPADLPQDGAGNPDLRPLLGHPAWQGPLADAAARAAAAQLGCALHLAPVTARIRTEAAAAVIDTLPATHAAHHRGDIDGYRVAIIADATAVLAGGRRGRVERQVLPGAGSRTPGVVRAHTDRAVIAADPRAAARRAERARAGRGVRLDRDRDDMAVFRAMVGGVDGQVAFGVLDEQAAALTAAGLAAGRGASQLRADIFCDLFHTLARTGHAHLTTRHDTGHATNADSSTGTDQPTEGGDTGPGGVGVVGRHTGVQPCRGDCPDSHPGPGRGPAGPAGAVVGRRRGVALNVYLDAATLAALDDHPGELAGYGTITAATARALAASADTIRALILQPATDDSGGGGTGAAGPPPDTAGPPGSAGSGVHTDNPARSRTCGTILDAGRAVYRPPEAVADYVTARDRTCCWPGCRAPGQRCDTDHRHPFGAGGATCACNLDLLCRWHHRIKTFTAWQAEPGPDGTLIWTSPTGHRYPTEPGHPSLDRAGAPPTSTHTSTESGSPPGSGTEHATPDSPGPGDPADDPPPF